MVSAKPKACLILRNGPVAGTRYRLAEGVTRIGRSAENEIVVQAATVSLFHAEISGNGRGATLRDLGSTNGTFLDGERIDEAELRPHAVVRLGDDGPEFTFEAEGSEPGELDRTLEVPHDACGSTNALLSEAVTQARRARAEGFGNQTMNIMRGVLAHALRRSGKRQRAWIYALAASLAAVSLYGALSIARLRSEKASLDGKIRGIETQLGGAASDPRQMESLLSQLDRYQGQAESLQRNVLYRLSAPVKEDFLTSQIRAVMTEFGAEVYSIPPDFVARVNHYIQIYQGPGRQVMARALMHYDGQLETMRGLLERQKLPPDLAYIPLVESTLDDRATNATGAAGPWQLTAGTARALGLRADQRYELQPSTLAACRYLRNLILDFGAGSSVMLALAAYDLGPTKVKQAIAKTVEDPIKQRNFWYLYRARALPAETREYVPKVFAAILIGRDPQRFGFR